MFYAVDSLFGISIGTFFALQMSLHPGLLKMVLY